MAFYFKNTQKDIAMTGKEEENYKKIIKCRFCEKKL